MKNASKTTYFIESRTVEIVSSVLCNSSYGSSNWVKQFIFVEEDLLDAYNEQIKFCDDLFKTISKI